MNIKIDISVIPYQLLGVMFISTTRFKIKFHKEVTVAPKILSLSIIIIILQNKERADSKSFGDIIKKRFNIQLFISVLHLIRNLNCGKHMMMLKTTIV